MRTLVPFADRFWKKVIKSDTCWIYPATQEAGRDRRGTVYVDKNHRRVQAHRASWMLHFGPIPDGLCVCHKCDNGQCVRPDHLFLGTHKDNMDDMFAKGRNSPTPHKYGSEHHASKLTADDVRSIVSEFKSGVSVNRLARRHNITYPSVQRILSGLHWTAVTGGEDIFTGTPKPPRDTPSGLNSPYSKLTAEQVVAIRQAVASGRVHHNVAAEFGISRGLVTAVCSRRKYQDVP